MNRVVIVLKKSECPPPLKRLGVPVAKNRGRWAQKLAHRHVRQRKNSQKQAVDNRLC